MVQRGPIYDDINHPFSQPESKARPHGELVQTGLDSVSPRTLESGASGASESGASGASESGASGASESGASGAATGSAEKEDPMDKQDKLDKAAEKQMEALKGSEVSRATWGRRRAKQAGHLPSLWSPRQRIAGQRVRTCRR